MQFHEALLGAWAPYLADAAATPEFQALWRRVEAARQTTTVYPPAGQEFFALIATPPEDVRVVILGQDPYHEPNQALGLAFSVAKGVRLPPSLRNIYQELESDTGLTPPAHGDLTAWAHQGVLLLNTVLTVEQGKANSHARWGWQTFTDAILSATNQLSQPIVFILWGGQAQKKATLIQTDAPRLLLCAPHPSPLSSYRGFFGSRPFSRCNEFLIARNATPVDWRLETV